MSKVSNKARKQQTSSKAGAKKQSTPPKQVQQTQQAQQAQSRAKTAYPEAASVEASKREARMQRQAEARAAAQRRQRAKNMRRMGIGAAVVLALLVLVVALYLREASKPGESVPMQASPHVQPGQAQAGYSTDPPTSGPHYGTELPEWKVYTESIPLELQVHGLEDGAVVISYQPNLTNTVKDHLARITKLYLEQPSPKNHILMVPHEGLSHPIVLTAWRRIDRLDELDEARIRRFIDAYIGIDHHAEAEGTRR